MKKFLVLLILPILLLAGKESFIAGWTMPTATYLYENPTVIHLPCGIDLDTRDEDAGLPADLILSREQEGIGTYLVQFDGPIYAHERRVLEEQGAVIQGYLPNYTYIVRMDKTTRSQIENMPGVSWVGNYEPTYKLCPEISLEADVPETLVVTLYAGTEGEAIRETVEALDGELLCWQATNWQTFVHITLSPRKLHLLVHEPLIKWIEPYHQSYPMNEKAQWVIQTWEENNRRIWNKGLTGEGQILATSDGGIYTSHNFFRDPSIPINDFGNYASHRKIIAYTKSGIDNPDDPLIWFGDEDGHGTHTAGSVLGDGRPVGSWSPNIGMAPEARLYFIDAGGKNPLTFPPSLEWCFNNAYEGNSAGGARIISNSWGHQSTRAYDYSCADVDQIMWDRPDYLVLFSGGNIDKGQYTGAPANAKNVLAVGACKNGDSANFFYAGSSEGPSLDGRIRPDIVAPGYNVISASKSSSDAEIPASGTSMSCPIAAGNAVLIRQYFTDGWYPSGTPSTDGFNPSAALIKAMMINSVETDYFADNEEVPSKKVGWGRPKLDNVLYFPGDNRKLALVDFDEGLETGYQFLGTVKVEGSDESLRFTLSWTDYPAEQFASPALVNDLNLEVASPSDKIYRGNNFDDNVSLEGGEFDTKNPTENVFVASPDTGEWEIRIKANNIPCGPQPFGLVVTGELGSSISSILLNDVSVDDDGQLNPNGNMDPGEEATIYATIQNVCEIDFHNVTAILSTSSTEVTITDKQANYDTLTADESKKGDGFKVAVSSSAAPETWVEFKMEISSDEFSGSLNFELIIGTPRYEWISHDVGGVKLTVTQQGCIGVLERDGAGEGFHYPKGSLNWLYLASFAAGNSPDYVNDRMYGEGETQIKNKDWKVTSNPDGRVIIGRSDYSDEDSWASYNDDGNEETGKGLQVQQFGYAWKGKNYVILKFVLANHNTSSLNDMYAGLMADFDMGPESLDPYRNAGGTDKNLNLAYMKQRADVDNPHVGVKLLRGQKANVTMIANAEYVHNLKWNDETLFKFLKGKLSLASAPSEADWSVLVSSGPFDLSPGATDTVAFAFVAGENLDDLKANAQDAQATWDTMKFSGIEEDGFDAPTTLDLKASPELITGKGTIMFSLPNATHVRLNIFDLSGRKVNTLVDDNLIAGRHEIYWNGRDQKGRKVSNGVYFISLTANDARLVYKAVIIR